MTTEQPDQAIWCNISARKTYYSKSLSEAQPYRTSPDDDRLIKLAFFQERWEHVVDRFIHGAFSRGLSAGRVCIGCGETSAQPYLDMLAVAICHLKAPAPAKVLEVLRNSFGISQQQWEQFLTEPKHREQRTISKLKNRCRPRVGAAEPLTLENALRKGDTARARYVVRYIQSADNYLEEAQRAVERYAETGDDHHLETFVALVTGSGITSVSHSFLFAAFGHDSFRLFQIPFAPVNITELSRMLRFRIYVPCFSKAAAREINVCHVATMSTLTNRSHYKEFFPRRKFALWRSRHNIKEKISDYRIIRDTVIGATAVQLQGHHG
jgi:hypothetical protein